MNDVNDALVPALLCGGVFVYPNSIGPCGLFFYLPPLFFLFNSPQLCGLRAAVGPLSGQEKRVREMEGDIILRYIVARCCILIYIYVG